MSALAQCSWGPTVSARPGLHPALTDPWEMAQTMGDDVVFAVLTKTIGPAYRRIGAAMAIAADGRFAGAITSGCIEADLVAQAQKLRENNGAPVTLRYGAGSPWFDLQLPCGGAVEVLMFRLLDPAILPQLSQAQASRLPVSIEISADGRLCLATGAKTRATPDTPSCVFSIGFEPNLRFVVLGTGPEALSFAALAAGLGHDYVLMSHGPATLASAKVQGLTAAPLNRVSDLASAQIDPRTAVTLFYHDHDYEPALIQAVLQTPAFYIGAQGSRRAQESRIRQLRSLGLSDAAITRVRGPIGLIPSTRDAASLAVSVMAEIVSIAAEMASAAA